MVIGSAILRAFLSAANWIRYITANIFDSWRHCAVMFGVAESPRAAVPSAARVGSPGCGVFEEIVAEGFGCGGLGLLFRGCCGGFVGDLQALCRNEIPGHISSYPALDSLPLGGLRFPYAAFSLNFKMNKSGLIWRRKVFEPSKGSFDPPLLRSDPAVQQTCPNNRARSRVLSRRQRNPSRVNATVLKYPFGYSYNQSERWQE